MKIGSQKPYPLAVALCSELEPEVELQRTPDVDAAGTEFDNCSDHWPSPEEFCQALEQQPLIVRSRHVVRALADDALAAPPAHGFRMQRAAFVVEAEEEGLSPIANAGVPIDEAHTLGLAEMVRHNLLQREVRPFARSAAKIIALRKLILATRERVEQRIRAMRGTETIERLGVSQQRRQRPVLDRQMLI